MSIERVMMCGQGALRLRDIVAISIWAQIWVCQGTVYNGLGCRPLHVGYGQYNKIRDPC